MQIGTGLPTSASTRRWKKQRAKAHHTRCLATTYQALLPTRCTVQHVHLTHTQARCCQLVSCRWQRQPCSFSGEHAPTAAARPPCDGRLQNKAEPCCTVALLAACQTTGRKTAKGQVHIDVLFSVRPPHTGRQCAGSTIINSSCGGGSSINLPLRVCWSLDVH